MSKLDGELDAALFNAPTLNDTPQKEDYNESAAMIAMMDNISKAINKVVVKAQAQTAATHCLKQWSDNNGVECNLIGSYYLRNTSYYSNLSFKSNGDSALTKFIIDSGCTTHCISDINLFTRIIDHSPHVRVKVANNRYVYVKAIGDVEMIVTDDHGKTRTIVLHNAFFTPDIPPNLVSTKMLFNDSNITTILTDRCQLKWSETDVLEIPCNGIHYLLNAQVNTVDGAADEREFTDVVMHCDDQSSAYITADIIHSRLGHPGVDRAVAALNRSTGLPPVGDFRTSLTNVCDSCARGGARLKPFNRRKPEFKFVRFGQRVQSDLCGPFPLSVSRNFAYMLSFVDSFTGKLDLFFLQDKNSSSVLQCLETYQCRYADALSTGKIEEWFTDNGGEFMSNDIQDFCDEFAVKRGFTVPYGSPQNGQAERLWAVLQRCMRIILTESNLPESFWHYAAKHAAWLYNHLPTKHNPGNISPQEACDGKIPDFRKIRVFG